jgi:hypothetical protein
VGDAGDACNDIRGSRQAAVMSSLKLYLSFRPLPVPIYSQPGNDLSKIKRKMIDGDRFRTPSIGTPIDMADVSRFHNLSG